MGVATPVPPIHMSWGGDETFDSLRTLGQNLEFVIEGEYIAEDEPRPDFRDARGRRFRILVMSLEVVLCVAVPADYDPHQLELATISEADRLIIVEHLRGEIHRALNAPSGQDEPVEAVTPDELERLSGQTLRDDEATPPELSWLDFDQLWFAAVDPSLPIDFGAAFRRLLSRVHVWKRP